MAILAAIEVGRSSELPGVLVAVAVRAALKLHLVERVSSSRKMTLRTPQRGMLALQWILGRRVFLQPELRRLEAIDAVAR